MLASLPDFPRSVLAFAIVLGVLVSIHELGHYLAARWRGVYVEVFSIGFGRAIATWTDRAGTVWKLAWLPLGGYVKLHGQERPEDVPEAVRARWKAGRTFHEKSVLSRAVIIAAGPFANFLLAAVLFSGLFAVIGRPVATQSPTAVVDAVVPDSAAARAGLRTGDTVAAIGDETVGSFADIQRIVSSHPGESLALHLVRDGRPVEATATTDAVTEGGKQIGRLGISSSQPVIYERVGPLQAVAAGLRQTWEDGRRTVEGYGLLLTGRIGAENLGGPLRIAQMSGQIARQGASVLVNFIAVLSINLGLINLFPIPILDGGHLLFLGAEAVRGRPIPTRAQEYGFRAGLAVLMTLFVFATWNDLSNLGVVRWVAGLIG